MKLIGPTSCSAKRSDLFLPKVRYVRKNEGSFEPAFVTNELGENEGVFEKKNEGAFGKNAGPLESVFACVRVHTLVRSPEQKHWRSHCIYTGFRMDSHIFLSLKKFTGPEWGTEWGPK